jgi:hypothetical protein
MKTNGNTGEEECVVYGPTTRTAWKEYCQSLCKNDKKPSNKNNNSRKNEEREVEEEDGGKEIRQKKRHSSEKVKEKTTESKSDEENKTDDVKVQKPRGRPRKYPPGATAALNRAVKKGTKIAGVNEPRRPGRPPKDPKKKRDVNPLDTLHEQTLLSVQSAKSRLSPAPGCVDRKLSESSTEETCGVPSVIVKDSSIQAVNEEMDLLMNTWKRQMMDFLSYMQMPEFKASISKEIDEEQKRKQQLQTQVDAMEKAVKNLQERGVLALNVKLAELGIVANSADDVLDKAREIIAQNKALCEKEQQLQVDVSREEALHQEVQRMFEKNRKTLSQTEVTPRLSIESDSNTSLNGSVPQSPTSRTPAKSGTSILPSQSLTRPLVSNTNKGDKSTANTPANTVANASPILLPPPPPPPAVLPSNSRRGSAAKESKGKREPKKRAAKKSSSETSSSIDDIIADVSTAKKTVADANDAKSNDSSDSPINPGSQEESSTSKERLTLTLVINRGNNSASVKSPSRTPPDKSPFGAKNSPRSPHENKRRQKSSERDAKLPSKKTRSSKSSGPDTSSESETKIKIKLGSNKEPVSVEPVLPTPVSLAEKEQSQGKTSEVHYDVTRTNVSVSVAAGTATIPTSSTVSKSSSGTKRWQKGIDSNLLAVASHEMSLQNAQLEAAQAAASKELENRVAPSPSMSSSSRPSSTSSSFATNTSLPQHQSFSDLAFNRRTAMVNTPPQTPSPSFSTERAGTPGNSTSSSSLSPSLHHHVPGHHLPTPSTSSASNLSNHDAFHAELPHHHSSLSSAASHQQMSSAHYINSLQSMKNLASMSGPYNPSNRTISEQRTVTTPSATTIEVPKGRKPGRPPKKSISNDMWASVEAQSKSTDSVAPSTTSTPSISSNHPHLTSSLNQCQYPNEVASDYSVKSKQNSGSSSSSNYYNGLSTNPGISSISQHGSQSSSSSVIQSPANKSNNPAPSGRSSSGPTHHPDNMSNFYLPYSSQGKTFFEVII